MKRMKGHGDAASQRKKEPTTDGMNTESKYPPATPPLQPPVASAALTAGQDAPLQHSPVTGDVTVREV
jgi:hypothetical protein